MSRFLVKMLAVAAAHVVITTYLYGHGVQLFDVLESPEQVNALVFLAPTGLAFIGYAYIVVRFIRIAPLSDVTFFSIALITFVATAISLYCGMFVAINTFGS
jgi:hypothetical protein